MPESLGVSVIPLEENRSIQHMNILPSDERFKFSRLDGWLSVERADIGNVYDDSFGYLQGRHPRNLVKGTIEACFVNVASVNDRWIRIIGVHRSPGAQYSNCRKLIEVDLDAILARLRCFDQKEPRNMFGRREYRYSWSCRGFLGKMARPGFRILIILARS